MQQPIARLSLGAGAVAVALVLVYAARLPFELALLLGALSVVGVGVIYRWRRGYGRPERVRSWVAPVLEQGENTKATLPCWIGPPSAVPFGALSRSPYILMVTSRRVLFVPTGMGWAETDQPRVEMRYPLKGTRVTRLWLGLLEGGLVLSAPGNQEITVRLNRSRAADAQAVVAALGATGELGEPQSSVRAAMTTPPVDPANSEFIRAPRSGRRVVALILLGLTGAIWLLGIPYQPLVILMAILFWSLAYGIWSSASWAGTAFATLVAIVTVLVMGLACLVTYVGWNNSLGSGWGEAGLLLTLVPTAVFVGASAFAVWAVREPR